MTPRESKNASRDLDTWKKTYVRKALRNLDISSKYLSELIGNLYYYCREGRSFVPDPVGRGILLTDEYGDIISVRKPVITQYDKNSSGNDVKISKYSSYTFLTGNNKGKSRKYGEGILPIPQIPPPLFISPPSVDMGQRTEALLNRRPNEFVRLS